MASFVGKSLNAIGFRLASHHTSAEPAGSTLVAQKYRVYFGRPAAGVAVRQYNKASLVTSQAQSGTLVRVRDGPLTLHHQCLTPRLPESSIESNATAIWYFGLSSTYRYTGGDLLVVVSHTGMQPEQASGDSMSSAGTAPSSASDPGATSSGSGNLADTFGTGTGSGTGSSGSSGPKRATLQEGVTSTANDSGVSIDVEALEDTSSNGAAGSYRMAFEAASADEADTLAGILGFGVVVGSGQQASYANSSTPPRQPPTPSPPRPPVSQLSTDTMVAIGMTLSSAQDQGLVRVPGQVAEQQVSQGQAQGQQGTSSSTSPPASSNVVAGVLSAYGSVMLTGMSDLELLRNLSRQQGGALDVKVRKQVGG